MKPGDVTPIAFIDTETLSLQQTVWEVAVILADLTAPFPYDQANGARPTLTVTGTWVGFLDVPERLLAQADPKSLQLNRFYERHPRYRHPVHERRHWPAVARVDELDDGREYGRYWGAQTPENLVWHREIAAAELARLLAGRHVYGAVPWFDERHLSQALGVEGHVLAVHYHLIDAEAHLAGWLAGEAQARGKLVPLAALPPYRPSELTDLAGVPKLDETAHEAWADARWTLDVAARVWDAKVTWPPSEFHGLVEATPPEPARHWDPTWPKAPGTYHRLDGGLLPDDAVIVRNPDGSHQMAAQQKHWDEGALRLRDASRRQNERAEEPWTPEALNRLLEDVAADAARVDLDRERDDGYENESSFADPEAIEDAILDARAKLDADKPRRYLPYDTPVEWHDTWPDTAEGRRTGRVRAYNHDMTFCQVVADDNGARVEVNAEWMRPLPGPFVDEADTAWAANLDPADPPPPATPADIRAARGNNEPFVVEEVDFGEGAPQEPPGNPTRNVVASVDERTADQLLAALHNVEFESEHEMKELVNRLAGVVADQVADARRDAERWRAEHDAACKTVADMHAAAVGEVRGPRVGVVEDVRDLRDAYLTLKAADDERRKAARR